METSRSRGGGGAVSERGGAGASAGVCRRKAEAGAGTLAADMDLHCDCAAETPAAEPPSGKINKAAFKLFKKRKSGGTMPSIFGVKNKGDGKSSGPTGLVRSRTHDGLAEVLVLESGRKEEPRGGGDGGGGGGGRPNPGPPRAAGPGGGSLASSSVAKSHSFFSLLKKNGRSENGKGDPADASKAGGKQKRGLRGLFSGMRWHRKDKRAKAEAAEGRAAGGGLILPGSLTASLECVKEETPRAAREPEEPGQDAPRDPAGCGDIIADPEEEAGPSCDKHAPGPGKPALSTKNPGVVAYQGGGEEMASPDEVDDTYLQEFWDMLSQTEEQAPGPQEGAAKVAAALEAKVAPETPKDTRCVEAAKDASSVKRRRLNRIPIEPHPKEEPKHPEKEQQEGVPNSDEGYWDSTTPGPEEDSASSGKKAGIPRDSYSGDALYDLYADPDGSPATLPGGKDNEETSCLSRLKPVSPGTITCPLRTPGSLLKDSKIPISIKHLTNLPSSHPVVHQQPSRSEMPRTKIPVSKVLVRRVSNRGLAGTTIRATACHDSAKKL
ncbi:APC membrane recruitment protein 2 isoform X2 [Macaca thibetana thibetana]|uniref:APC membrane recruitment protein 2 n=2 Tax=Macaca mulatta TaxID=9544 RepID=F7HQM9_MACMU|nr:APC membrane recruitment protein 2 isoform X2 [Macaca mulatta]XP_005585563.2 APC membrane recruitment protein 2 isoform X2 [Macaca fascicularis]XP_050622815.1 APC membrane recruitment protein 2 isoform X2 [Macaca thibetana thibetana]